MNNTRIESKNRQIGIMAIRGALVALLCLIFVSTVFADGSNEDPTGETSAHSAIIDNGTIQMGVKDEGHLNVAGGTPSNGTTVVGLRYMPTNGESTSHGCLCEGWGVADASTGQYASANVAVGGVVNIGLDSFSSTASTAESVVTAFGRLKVTHDYHPSLVTPYLYEVTVTIENISATDVTDLRYTRVMDWDISPNPFYEYVTIQGFGSAANLLYTDDNGFQNPNPLLTRSAYNFTGNAVDSGPRDHGALFDFGFGSLLAGESMEFTTYYGAAGNEADALSALASVSAEAYSLGQYSGDPVGGTPNTFIFAFAGVGGESLFPTADPNGPYLGAINELINFDGTASNDPEDGNALTYDWDWGDGNSDLDAGSTPTHAYDATGIYDVCLTVTDSDGLTNEACTIAVVYDPDAGFVTGGGWIYSEPGAYKDNADLEGKANFGFVSKYKRGANVPTGNTEFQFKAGDLNFHSISYDWLVVTGSNTAIFQGSGTINGEGDYMFKLWAEDNPDTFRIRIWEEDESGVETDVYDNGTNQELGGGSIVVHTK